MLNSYGVKEKELVEKRLFSPLQQHLVSNKGYENETVVKKHYEYIVCKVTVKIVEHFL